MNLRFKSIDEVPELLRTDDVRQLAGAAPPAPTGYQRRPGSNPPPPSGAKPAPPMNPPTPKYRNQVTEIDGRRFDSKGEAQRYLTLKDLQAAGRIRELRMQPEFDLHAVTGKRAAVYVADFSYLDDAGELVVEDFKSPASAAKEAYRLKRAFFEAEYGITVREIYRVKRKKREKA